jgi:hypothetical protein
LPLPSVAPGTVSAPTMTPQLITIRGNEVRMACCLPCGSAMPSYAGVRRLVCPCASWRFRVKPDNSRPIVPVSQPVFRDTRVTVARTRTE